MIGYRFSAAAAMYLIILTYPLLSGIIKTANYSLNIQENNSTIIREGINK